MRCGFCLPACPTFRETGIEAESPRGRIALMKAVADGLMDPDEAFETQMNHCLGCRACEPACPADVKYGQLIEQARDAIEDHTTSHRWWVKTVRSVMFKQVFPKQRNMRLLGGALQLYQRTGLARLARGAGAMKLLPRHLADMEAIMPAASRTGVVDRIGEHVPARGPRIAKVGLFRGCLMDVLFTETNVKTAELLATAGFEVVIPPAQNCCGALHAHSGEAEGARALARRNIRAFREAGVDYIVSNAGGCGAALVEYDHLLHEDVQWREDAAWFAQRVIDVSELLMRSGRVTELLAVGLPETRDAAQAASSEAGSRASAPPVADGDPRAGAVAGGTPIAAAACAPAAETITYQDSCHLRNVMRSAEAPRRLLQQVAGTCYTEMCESDRCCGSAGIYNLTQPEMAGDILAHKMEHANRTGAGVILTSNPGCLLQMKLGVKRHGRDAEVTHVVDYLHRRLRIQEAPRRG
ncbi:(Fe-S)-binding protein [Paenibacillus sp. IB182496]|uniref:Glycolate oxidase iron-sulfur subunit n=2 Tax=Paenibacillus sabuli TaxID=2772509 RepID=A0A927BUT4_9BACL|nr:(Fe-S)-binding protein [Paenibacillus sabuli]MBD2847227.1 (Fe-S)-binding protein [Paenibacillus sabuli]